jgi:hypothetical protein
MSPLRRWMADHRMPAWYSWVVVVLLPIMASVGVLVVTLRVSERTTQEAVDRERAARVASEQVLCQVFIVLDDVYAETAPTTAAGKKLATAVAAVRASNHCAPRVPSR